MIDHNVEHIENGFNERGKDPDYAPYRKLSAAVLQQAVIDYRKGPKDHTEKAWKKYESAMRFLEEGDMYPWCDILDIEPEVIRENLS